MAINKIIDTVRELAEATKAAFKIDVMVVDDNKTIIVATGALESMVNNKVIECGLINNKIFKDKQHHFILTTPENNHICIGCDRYKKTCLYKDVVATSIYDNDMLAGVISANAITEEQVNLMKGNEQNILNFLNRISHLLSSKLTEDRMVKELKKTSIFLNNIYNKVNKGVIITSPDYKIIKVNDYIKKILCLKETDFIGKDIREIFHGINLYDNVSNLDASKYNEISMQVNGKRKFLFYTTTSILSDENINSIVYFFDDSKTFNEIINQFSPKSEHITLNDIVGEDKSLVEFKQKIQKVSVTDSTILLYGETGTGKELFARAIHNHSPRASEPFIAINCGAIPETLIESELFGYEKGSFTGALSKGKHGKFYMADKGTILLDEVETMPLYLQQKLLRFIERKEIERIGSSEYIPINVRIIAATNINLYEMVKRKEFREDLFHRLNVVGLFVPPLRERGQDPLVLADYFINKFNKKFNKNITGLSEEVKTLFLDYSWSGNVRELQNAVEYAINMETSNSIMVDNLPQNLKSYRQNNSSAINIDSGLITLEDLEKSHIIKVLNSCGYNDKGILKASEILGISRSTIYRKISKHRIKK